MLAADLGPADAPHDGVGPALVAAGAATAALVPAGAPATFRATGALDEALSFRPFF